LLAAALALGVAPAVATAAPHHAHPSSSAKFAAARSAWLAERARLGAHLPLAGRYGADVAGGSGAAFDKYVDDSAYLEPAGDLDRDGGQDFVDIRDHNEFDDTVGTFTESVRLEAHRGRDGAKLWSVSIPSATWIYVTFAKTGAKGLPGVLVTAYGGAGADAIVAGGGQDEALLYSYDNTGTLVFTKRLEGGEAGAPGGYGYTFDEIDGLLDANAGGGTDIVLSSIAGGGAYDPTDTADVSRERIQTSIVDGATGTERMLGDAIVTDGSLTYGVGLGDLDHDKLDDVGRISGVAGKPSLTALSSATGKALWSYAAKSPAYWGVDMLSDVTGDGVRDVSVLSFSESGAETVTLLDGKTGKARWTKAGSRLFVIGNADRKRGDEVVVGSNVGSSASGGSIGFTTAAYTAAGKRLWSVTRKVAKPSSSDKSYTRSYGPIGDANLDGVAEIGYGLSTGQGSKEHRDYGAIDGRTGRVSRDPVKDMWGTSVAIDGRGSDAYTRTLKGGLLTVTAWRGDRPSPLWTMSVKASGDVYSSYGTYADKDRCGDLLVSYGGDSGKTTLLISGATAKPVWAITRRGDAAATVSHPAAKKVRRFGPAAC
jgi:hypothetical protein